MVEFQSDINVMTILVVQYSVLILISVDQTLAVKLLSKLMVAMHSIFPLRPTYICLNGSHYVAGASSYNISICCRAVVGRLSGRLCPRNRRKPSAKQTWKTESSGKIQHVIHAKLIITHCVSRFISLFVCVCVFVCLFVCLLLLLLLLMMMMRRRRMRMTIVILLLCPFIF